VFNVNTGSAYTLELSREAGPEEVYQLEIWTSIISKDSMRIVSLTPLEFSDFVNQVLYDRGLRLIHPENGRDLMVYGLRESNPPPHRIKQVEDPDWNFDDE
jgi:hypothetical protein